jgi:predicted phosphodiesterase
MWNPFSHNKSHVEVLANGLLQKLEKKDPETIKLLAEQMDAHNDAELEQKRLAAIVSLKAGIATMKTEKHSADREYESHDPLISLLQTSVNDHVQREITDKGPEWLNKYGQGDIIAGWLPTGIAAILENFKGKSPFAQWKTPESSYFQIDQKCRIALLADWGADNSHAKNVAEQVKKAAPQYVIHLGDIYYSGAEGEARAFLRNWPLRDDQGSPLKGKSFALNGNHEMYTGGRAYFTTVLPAFGQEASYFVLWNKWWQFFGLDTAYVPFRLRNDTVDIRLEGQWDILRHFINANVGRQNIFLSHHQPYSAHAAEYAAGEPLRKDLEELSKVTHKDPIFAWFFGHEHRCAIYDDARIPFKARLIGNGAIPHDIQQEDQPETTPEGEKCCSFQLVNRAAFEGGLLAMSGFVLLDLDQNDMKVSYINENGSHFYDETWQAPS